MGEEIIWLSLLDDNRFFVGWGGGVSWDTNIGVWIPYLMRSLYIVEFCITIFCVSICLKLCFLLYVYVYVCISELYQDMLEYMKCSIHTSSLY